MSLNIHFCLFFSVAFIFFPSNNDCKENNKSVSSGRGSRNFSLSSERFIVEQVNKSRNGSRSSQLRHEGAPVEAVARPPFKSLEPRGSDVAVNWQHALIVPHEDDIEKSFRVNEDGSMTVEMKVHLTIKEAEVLHWTTTLSRASLSRKTVYASLTGSANSSPDSNNTVAKHSFVCEEETKEENCPVEPGRAVAFKKQKCESYTSAKEKAKSLSRRIPTPGPRQVKKMASVESVTTVTSSGVQEHTLGHYSYMERMADGETEGYCLVRHSRSSSSSRPVAKPRKTGSAGLSKEGSHAKRPTGVAEVLKIENNGMEVRETVMHIYEHQGCFDNYYANEGYDSEYAPVHASVSAADSKSSTVLSSSDIDISPAGSLQRQGEEMLSLSSESVDPEYKTRTAASSIKPSRRLKSGKKNVAKPSRTQKGSTSSSDRKTKEAAAIPSVKNKNPFSAKSTSNQKNVASSESAKSGTKSNSAEKPPVKPGRKGAKLAEKEEDILTTREHVTGSPPQGQSKSKAGAKAPGHNVNTPSIRPQMKKNISGILLPRKALQHSKKTSQPKSGQLVRTASPKKRSGLSESFSRPSPLPPPCEVHQYVENWLEKVSPDGEPYSEEAFTDESEAQAKVEFQIGGDSEESEKSEDHSHELCQSAGEQHVTGLCAGHQEKRWQTPRLTEAVLSADRDAASKQKIKPIVQHIWSAVQSIKRASDTKTPPSADKFSTQVASVFGSSCKLFLSFLSMMILQDYITGSQSRSAGEAALMMESLQRVSAAEDEEEQRASLEDLRNKASFQLKKSWKDFTDLSDRIETETELTLNVKAADVFEDRCLIIDELMGEMNISQDLREVISAAIRLASSFCPVEESDMLETERNQLDQAKESEAGEEDGWGEGTGDKMVTNVQEEWKIENDEKVEEGLKEEIQDGLGKVEAEEMEVSEEEFKDEEVGEDETNENTDEGTEEESEAHTEDVGESHEGKERLMEGTEGDGKDEMQSEGEDMNSGGDETVPFMGKDVACNVNEQQVRGEVIREEMGNGKNKKEDEKEAEEAGEQCAGNIKSVTTCEEENEQSDERTEQEGRYDESNEEGNDPNEAAEDLDLNSTGRTTVDSNLEQNTTESPFKHSSEEQCEDDKGNGAEDGEEHCEEQSNYLPHPLEISQELLDFVNSALQSSSLIFTYDLQGNVRLEPDNSQVPKQSKESPYGLKILPSPSTSELSDYRPETSESWGSKPQESTDIVTDSGDDASDKSLVSKHETKIHPQEPNAEPANTGSSGKAFRDIRGSISSFSSGTEPLREGSFKPATQVTQCSSVSLVGHSPDGVLIDQGRWLLKENHLIRKSPPLSSGMYGSADSTSTDSSQGNGKDTVTHTQTQLNPLTYISSSEIEELTKPKTPKCTYYNMPHGSDSDPFLDDCSLKSEKNATSGGKRRGFRVSPAIDTSKSWVSKNGSLSSFASVEFKMPDGKIHPEEESSAVAQTRRTSSGGMRVLQAQDSQDALHVRCSQYCPIL